MGKIIYVTGGARSGKSSFAQQLAEPYGGDVGYIATAIAFDDEMRARIRLHRQDRDARWATYERWQDVAGLIAQAAHGAYLLDCLTVMATNLMFSVIGDEEDPAHELSQRAQSLVLEQTESLLHAAGQSRADLIIVSNELGMGVVPAYPLGRLFRDIAGRANQLAASHAHEAYLLVSGIPLRLK